METAIKSAVVNAGLKAAIGLSLVAGLIAIRLVSATPEGVKAGIEELERLDAQLSAESTGANSNGSSVATGGDESMVSKMTAGVRERMGASDSRTRDGEKLVSCVVSGRTHFMRADDCAMRRGQSSVIEPDR